MFLIFILLCLLSTIQCGLNQTSEIQVQRTHFPQHLTQTHMRQCPFGTICRSVLQCQNHQKLRPNPRQRSDINFCGFKHNLPMVCCKLPSDRQNPYQRDHNYRNPTHHNKENKRIKNFEICGTRLKQISLYIVGGSRVLSVTKYPWFASVALVKDSSYLTGDSQDEPKVNNDQKQLNLHHYCGSSILSDTWLISSAHCFPIRGVDEQDLANYRIGVGDIELGKMKIHEIEEVLIHPNASAENHYNDIALIKLKSNQKLKFSSKVRPICLPFLEFDDVRSNELNENGKEDDSNKFNLPDLDRTDRNQYGFRNNRYEQSEPFYGFPNPNYRPPNYNENFYQRRRNFPFRFSDGHMNGFNQFYQFRSKRSSDIKFNKDSVYDELFSKPNTKVTVAGLGDTSFGGTPSDVLREADLMIVNKYKCNELYVKLKSPSLNKGLLNQEFICAADRRLAKKLNDDESSLIDRRGTNSNRQNWQNRSRERSKRSISQWINFFTDRIKERRSKRMDRKEHTNLEEDIKLKEDNKTLESMSSDKLILKTSDPGDAEKDLVNLLSEEELREKLALSYSDSCQGDSGGPLIFNLDSDQLDNTMNEHKNNQLIMEKLNRIKPMFKKLEQKGLENSKFYLTGIVSMGRECGNKDYPGVYVSVMYHKNWILNNVDFDSEKFKL